jgi:hypothetical protein
MVMTIPSDSSVVEHFSQNSLASPAAMDRKIVGDDSIKWKSIKADDPAKSNRGREVGSGEHSSVNATE